jgi:hypothetical protein
LTFDTQGEIIIFVERIPALARQLDVALALIRIYSFFKGVASRKGKLPDAHSETPERGQS